MEISSLGAQQTLKIGSQNHSKIDENPVPESLESILLSESLKVIEEGAFLRCSALKSLVMPEAVTTVGESAFQECTSLVSATLSNSLTGLSRSMFEGCSSLRVVKPNERPRSRSGSSGKNKRSRSTGDVD